MQWRCVMTLIEFIVIRINTFAGGCSEAEQRSDTNGGGA